MKKFNTTGLCIPNKHYMVDTTDKINKIVKLIEDEEYFTINQSRQYGKTTTIYLLKNRLKSKYEIINISFEGIGEGPFSSNKRFVNMFIDRVAKAMKFTNIKEEDITSWTAEENYEEENAVVYLSDKISGLCEKYEIILMVDEMDKCSDNQVFLNFLGILREKYLSRNAGEDFTFKSVILAGVYDVKNLKLKLRPNEERKYNSPWNTREGIRKAVKNYYYADSTLKDDLIKNYENNTALNELIDDMLLRGMEYTFVSTDEAVSTGKIFGIFSKSKSGDGKLTISNIIFENILTDHVLMKYARAKIIRQPEKSQFIKEDGHLDMIRILDRFQALMKAEYRIEDKEIYEVIV